jgi:hypothetical protein
MIRPNRRHRAVPAEFWKRYMSVSPYKDNRSTMVSLWLTSVGGGVLKVLSTLLYSYRTSPLPVESLFGYRPKHLGETTSEGKPTLYVEFAALTNTSLGGLNFLHFWITRQGLLDIPVLVKGSDGKMVLARPTHMVNFAHVNSRPLYENERWGLGLPRQNDEPIEGIWDIYEFDRAKWLELANRRNLPSHRETIQAWLDWNNVRDEKVTTPTIQVHEPWWFNEDRSKCPYELIK